MRKLLIILSISSLCLAGYLGNAWGTRVSVVKWGTDSSGSRYTAPDDTWDCPPLWWILDTLAASCDTVTYADTALYLKDKADSAAIADTVKKKVATALLADTAIKVRGDSVGKAAFSYAADQWKSNTQSGGVLYGGALSNGTDSFVNIAAGGGYFKVADSSRARDTLLTWGSTSKVPPNQVLAYFYVDGSNPASVTVRCTTDFAYINGNTRIFLGRSFREGTDNLVANTGLRVPNFQWQEAIRLRLRGIERYSGAMVSESTGRIVKVTSGLFYLGTQPCTTAAVSASSGIEFYWRNGTGGAWHESTGTKIDSTRYDSAGAGLKTLANARYGVHWLYMTLGGEMALVYGQGSYTLSQAETASVRAVPPEISAMGTVVGKAIVAKSGSVLTLLTSAYQQAYRVGVPTNHNELNGLDGGATGYYGHMVPQVTTSGSKLQLRGAQDTIVQIDTASNDSSLWWIQTAAGAGHGVHHRSNDSVFWDGTYRKVSGNMDATGWVHVVGTDSASTQKAPTGVFSSSVGIGGAAAPALGLSVEGPCYYRGGLRCDSAKTALDSSAIYLFVGSKKATILLGSP